jgi:hypothetical protein
MLDGVNLTLPFCDFGSLYNIYGTPIMWKVQQLCIISTVCHHHKYIHNTNTRTITQELYSALAFLDA